MKLIHNGSIVTMDAERRMLIDSSIVLDGDRIEWIGPAAAVPAKYQSSSQFDASGMVVYPGFINIHTHVALSILRGVADDLGVAPSYSPKVPQGVNFSSHDCYIFSMLGGLEALKFGTTCIVDNYIYAHETARAFDELGIRAVVSERLHDADLAKVPLGKYEFDPAIGEELLQRGVDLINRWEDSPQNRVRCRLGPMAPDTCSTEYLNLIRKTAKDNQVGLVIHLAQSKREMRAIQTRAGQTPTGYLSELGLLGPDVIAGHCIYVNEEDIEILASSKTNVSHQSGSNSKGGMMAPIRRMVEKGINVGLGTDNMAGDMIEVMRLAVCVARMLDENPTALLAQDVLEMATINGAKALGLEAEIGSIEVGKKADLVLIDYRRPHLVPIIDPVSNLIHNGLGNDVDTVFVDGEILVEHGKTRSVDEPSLLKEAQTLASARWAEIE